jgi:hypothetical protein
MPLARHSERAAQAADPADADAQNDRIGAPRLMIADESPTAQIGGYARFGCNEGDDGS